MKISFGYAVKCCIALLMMAGYASSGSDTNIDQLIREVNQDTLRATVQRLQNFKSRYLTHDSCRSAEQWIHDYFNMIGLDSVYFDTAQFQTTNIRNIIGTIPGDGKPDSIIVIGGHMDACLWNKQQGFLPDQSWAPGADDNGTGTAAVLEIARVLKKYKARFRWTLKFVAFSGEEQWEVGSKHWVNSVVSPKRMKLHSFFNIDMIGFHKPSVDSNLMYVVPNTASQHISRMADSVNQWYDLNLYLNTTVKNNQSGDHTPFWEKNYDGVMISEAAQEDIWDNDAYPCYHTVCDTIGNIMFGLVKRTTQMVLGAATTFAHPVSVTPVAEPRSVPGPLPEAHLTIQQVANGWTISLPLDAAGSFLAIRSLNGREITRLSVQGKTVFWNGKDRSGTRVATGVYVLMQKTRKRTSSARICVAR